MADWPPQGAPIEEVQAFLVDIGNMGRLSLEIVLLKRQGKRRPLDT
jgi:hypothetical protein